MAKSSRRRPNPAQTRQWDASEADHAHQVGALACMPLLASARPNQPRQAAGHPTAPKDPNGLPLFTWGEGDQHVKPRDDGRAAHLPALRAIGLGGLIDAHCHWFPMTVLRKIWAYFDEHYWPITYRQMPEGRLEWLHRNKVSAYTTLNYAHRPNMAAWLNEWTRDFADRNPAAIPCGTFYQEPGVEDEVARCVEEYGFKGFKLHVRVSRMDPTQDLLHGAFARVARAGLPVVIHIGSAPDPGEFTAPGYLRTLLETHPDLKVIVAHMGAWEWADYVDMAEAFPNVYLDTTMVFTGFVACDPYPAELMARLEGLSHKLLFGSDFPNIPYPLSHAVQGILALPLSDGAKRRILAENAAAMFGVPVPNLPDWPAESA